ncbi:hypothetical protein [Ralstonia sp. 3PA37C10]|jgi:hypothetical protein|uniref:hypothetical protein n=1 Tax=Ralstonia sp. 3PA37C10 TaxID=2502217 RepID=UPI0010F60DD7|nr:hypothetical protein [Ralstonia sp. 3PA37C10]
MLNEGMFIEDWRARMGDSVALTTATVTEYLRMRDAESLRAQADAGPINEAAEFNAWIERGGCKEWQRYDAWLGWMGRSLLHPSLPAAQGLSDDWQRLMQFYRVETPEALIAAMERHIEKLQEKRSNEPAFTRVREG